MNGPVKKYGVRSFLFYGYIIYTASYVNIHYVGLSHDTYFIPHRYHPGFPSLPSKLPLPYFYQHPPRLIVAANSITSTSWVAVGCSAVACPKIPAAPSIAGSFANRRVGPVGLRYAALVAARKVMTAGRIPLGTFSK